jgi:hypothetical protein
MKILILALLAMTACHKTGPGVPADPVTTPISNSAGSYTPNANNVPGTAGDPTGVGATGVAPNDVGNAPMPDNIVPPAQAMEPTAPVGPTP